MMSHQYYANPYNISVTGFYFVDYADYLKQSENLKDGFGQSVEEFSIEYINGDNARLFNILKVNQATLSLWFEGFEDLEGDDLIKVIYLAEYLNVDMSEIHDRIDDVGLYVGSALDYAEEYIEDCGLLHKMPENLRCYFDTKSFARDMVLSGDITEVEIIGKIFTVWG